MKRILIFAALLALALPAWGAVQHLQVIGATLLDGAVDVGDAVGDVITVNGTMTLQEATGFAAGTAALPGLHPDGDPDTGFYAVGADDLGITAAGAQVAHFDATGVAAVGFNGPLGTVTPAQVEATNIYGDGLHYFGNGPEDLHEGYKERSEYITWQDDFTDGVDATYGVKWNIAGVVGLGTNTVTVRDGWSELVTAAAGGPDMESTVAVSPGWVALAAPRLEAVVELTAANTQRFEIGWYIAGNELVEIIYDTAQGPNWMLEVDDTTGVVRLDSGIAVVGGTPYKLEIAIDVAGDITWAIDDAAMGLGALAIGMTANPYSTRWMLTNIAAANNTAAVDYVQIEYLKVQ